jgi:hypothetical protein
MPPATAISMSPVAIPWCAEHHCLQPEPAHLVDRQGGDAVGESTAQGRLPGRILAETG